MTFSRLIFAVCAVLLAACTARAPDAPGQPAPYRLVDFAGAYTEFWDATQGLATAQRVKAFHAKFDALFPGFYSAARLKMTPAAYDEHIAKSFARFPAIRDRYIAMETEFSAMLAPAYASFIQRFGDMAPIGPIYLIHALGEMDGGTRSIGGQRLFLFGTDVMAEIHTPADTRAFFHHELFHIYHGQWFKECDQVWCSLWAEGLAVLTAKRLDPDATDADLLLNFPEPIPPAVDAHFSEAVCAVRARLDSAASADTRPLFSNGRLNAHLPPRFAYYVGLRLAMVAEAHRSIEELAHLSNADARTLVGATLEEMATCP